MTKGNLSKLIFLDSSMNTHGDSTKILVPPMPFSAKSNESIALTLVNFGIRRNWPNINVTNGIFYLYQNVGGTTPTYTEVRIADGFYNAFKGSSGTPLLGAIEMAVNGVLANLEDPATTCSYSFDDATRRYTFTFSHNSSNPISVRCFHCKQGVPPTGVSAAGFYNDSYQLLGGYRITDPAAITVESLDNSTPNTAVSYYPASLNTLDALYVRLRSPSPHNYMTTSMDANLTTQERLVESEIFARIPLENAFFTKQHEMVHFEDSGSDAYQCMLNQKILDSLEIRLTDDKGRNLAEILPFQSQVGLMTFHMCLRFDVFFSPEHNIGEAGKPFNLRSKPFYPLNAAP